MSRRHKGGGAHYQFMRYFARVVDPIDGSLGVSTNSDTIRDLKDDLLTQPDGTRIRVWERARRSGAEYLVADYIRSGGTIRREAPRS
jgi:hypothetical protein